MSLKAVKIAALLSSGILSGNSFYISTFAIPAILSPYKATTKTQQQDQVVLPTKTLQTQWKHIYDTGKFFFPLLSLQTSAIYLYLAAHEPSNASKLYVFAAASTIAMVPYTVTLMMGNIKKIEAEVKEDDAQDTVRLRKEIVKWSNFHFGRVTLVFVGFLLGTWATVDSL